MIMEAWGFRPINFTLKSALNFLFNSLAVLVRHSQTKNVFGSTLNPSNRLL